MTRIVLEINPHDAENRGIKEGDWVRLASGRAKPRCGPTITDKVSPGVVYTTFHHPDTQANVITTDFSDWATNCPEYKVTAVQVAVQRPVRMAGGVQRPGHPVAPDSGGGMIGARATPRLVFGSLGSAGGRVLPEEVAVALSFNGTTQAVMMATPADLEDFGVGFA
jgi:formylmethanofuran dehydrogenase subunit D